MGISIRQKLINFLTRRVQKPVLRYVTSQKMARTTYALNAAMLGRRPKGYRQSVALMEIPGHTVKSTWVNLSGPTKRGVILYLHGGGFVLGTLQGYRHVVSRLADMAGMSCLFVNYRLAPEHPFPAATTDALTAYAALLQDGHSAKSIAIVGDSAGGALALGLLLQIKQHRLPMPGAMALISPVTDMTSMSGSYSSNEDSDMLVSKAWAERAWADYLQGQDPSHPLISPVNGDFRGAPPTLIQVVTSEMLYDDSLRITAKLHDAGVNVRLDEWRDVPHVWHLAAGITPEANEGISHIADFLIETLPKSPA